MNLVRLHSVYSRPQNLFHGGVTSSNLVWISNELNAWKHCISQLAGLIKTILMRHVERSVYCKFIALLFLLGALNGSRGSTGSQDSGSDVGHLWFVVQIWTKWSYKTIVAAWVHYNQQYNILKKAQILQTVEGSKFKFLATSAFERFNVSTTITGLAGLEDCC